VEKILYRGVPRLLKMRYLNNRVSARYVHGGTRQLVEISGLAKELKISRQTLSNYLTYLEGSFLIRKLYNFEKQEKNGKKIEENTIQR
jgi:predicted AAA+ superfamily ATPase